MPALQYLGAQDTTPSRIAVKSEVGGASSSSIYYNSCVLSADFVLPAGMCSVQARSLEIAINKTFEIGLASIFDII